MALLTGISKDRRDAAIEDARIAGRLGATRLPASVLMATGDPTDSMILERLDALEAGRAERPRDRYLNWLRTNFVKLSNACADVGIRNGLEWLHQQYQRETGLLP
jgi:hypothetical protein